MIFTASGEPRLAARDGMFTGDMESQTQNR